MSVIGDLANRALGGLLGGDRGKGGAQATGQDAHGAASGLAALLPGLVDKLTPDGQIPQQDSLEKMLGAFNIDR